jgi:mRNA degradation ribonuclease J1/J2
VGSAEDPSAGARRGRPPRGAGIAGRDVGRPARRAGAQRRHAEAGAVNVVLDDRYEIAGEPDLVAIGVAKTDRSGELLEEIMLDAAIGAIESIPRVRRKDLDLVEESTRRAVRAAADEVWGKKPIVTVFVTR